MNPVMRRYAGYNVPRYTSYPTAADFSADVGVKDHEVWLAGLGAGQAVSVYLHVPYCRKICLYCGCTTKMAVRDDVVGAYRRALETEIDLVAGLLGERPEILRLHWGGGTPSILGPDGLRSAIAALRRQFPFANGSEHAIELDPRHVTVALVEALAELGVTRASLGVQDVNPLVQAAIGRVQPLFVVEAAVERLRSVEIRNLNFDLMYGLPLQTAASIRKTCALVAAMGPDRIACFGYAHLPRLKANQRRIDEAKLPSQDQRIEQAEVMSEELVGAGYVRIGIDHFAKPGDALARAAAGGKLHRNFQGYTEDASGALLGLGASSISTFADGFVQNVADVPRYVGAIAAGSLASARGCRRDENDRQRAHIIERLMCDFTVDLDDVAPNAEFRNELARLTPMQSEGLVEIAGAKLTVTQAGRAVVRVIAATFDTYRCAQAAQFSNAI
ncbi:oxygen-independent coproporphyrinogen III oxidase [Bradyrhizobium diversitatis]|uniref:Coproporphyrinogen-III oxidase n=1 Tax=Bradyrhizobium diversitatis TaxID=2755406 RepID=A0ABS0PF31_9BRAD|nr:oxygen-independent coproporphyrinogen III oxidase [Bradyrhizobium diversitatis]MBH5391918.1 oxygen-independent coproporphyrinogen III oxidase [Bradyrhizobium diversitatis]